MSKYLTAEKARKMTEKAAERARNKCYHRIISSIEDSIRVRIDDGEYRYHTTFKKREWMDDHMADCLQKHFRAYGFSVEAKLVETDEYNWDYYDFTISWDV